MGRVDEEPALVGRRLLADGAGLGQRDDRVEGVFLGGAQVAAGVAQQHRHDDGDSQREQGGGGDGRVESAPEPAAQVRLGDHHGDQQDDADQHDQDDAEGGCGPVVGVGGGQVGAAGRDEGLGVGQQGGCEGGGLPVDGEFGGRRVAGRVVAGRVE
ncbi:MAG TPA: hypothetical protein VFW65_04065 [Pseudonocardiaceae bacterium]|nr:hypothetical protein [Pseudonocardiaceae bacterium]